MHQVSFGRFKGASAFFRLHLCHGGPLFCFGKMIA